MCCGQPGAGRAPTTRCARLGRAAMSSSSSLGYCGGAASVPPLLSRMTAAPRAAHNNRAATTRTRAGSSARHGEEVHHPVDEADHAGRAGMVVAECGRFCLLFVWLWLHARWGGAFFFV